MAADDDPAQQHYIGKKIRVCTPVIYHGTPPRRLCSHSAYIRSPGFMAFTSLHSTLGILGISLSQGRCSPLPKYMAWQVEHGLHFSLHLPLCPVTFVQGTTGWTSATIPDHVAGKAIRAVALSNEDIPSQWYVGKCFL